MLNITGLNKVTKLEVNERGTVVYGVLYNSYKKWDKDKNQQSATEYETEFVNCRFVGDAAKMAMSLSNKDKIMIDEAELRMQKNKYPVVTIFKFSTGIDNLSYK